MILTVNLLFVTILIFINIFNCNGGNNCNSEYCRNSKQQTQCKRSRDPARHCNDYELTVSSEKEKIAILDKINSRRNKVASGEIRSFAPAANMMRVEWNTELEISAQSWANQCVQHDVPDIEDSCRHLGKVFVGQNIATVFGESPGLSAATLVDVWFMELLHTNSSVMSRYQPSTDIGHPHYDYFTQLIWAESAEVGCGGVKFKELLKDDEKTNRTIYRLVCNFAAGGNLYNKTVYVEGIPCTKCPDEGVCDSEYRALCKSTLKSSHHKPIENSQVSTETGLLFPLIGTRLRNRLSDNDEVITEEEILSTSSEFSTDGNEDDISLDYFSLVHEFTEKENLRTTTAKPGECNDMMIVEDFVDLLKKKLISDPGLKQLLLSDNFTMETSTSDNTFTDSNVAAFANRIYSRKEPSTTVKTTYNDYLNSTLLVDLVEAVIFRSGDKLLASEELPHTTEPVMEVNAVKIQAELAEVLPNQDFTGHYFFPEDDEEETSSEATEAYYDSPNIQVTDIVLEIDDLMKTSSTQDFLDEIFESEEVTESTTTVKLLSPDDMKLHKEGNKNMKKFLKDIEDQTRGREIE